MAVSIGLKMASVLAATDVTLPAREGLGMHEQRTSDSGVNLEPACNGRCNGAIADVDCPAHGIRRWLGIPTVSPSILITDERGVALWHGWLERGVWRLS